MNKNKQLWALIKFQLSVYPLIALVVMPLAIGAMFYSNSIVYLVNLHYDPPLDQMLSEQNLFLVAIFGMALLAPEIARTAASAQIPTGSEFVLTRAVDRPLVLRSRAVLYYFVVLILPLIALPLAATQPSLQVGEFSATAQQQVIEALPGSMAMDGAPYESRHDILVPHGAVLVAAWRFWVILAVAIIGEAFVMLIYPFQWRRWLLWVGFFLLVFASTSFLIFADHSSKHVTFTKRMFFGFVAHQPVIWLCTLAALVMAHLWGERRFAGAEQ